MKNTLFSNSFVFVEFAFGKYRYTDNRRGAPHHLLATMEEGRCRIVSEETIVEASAGDAFYIPMGLGYQSYWYGEETVRFRSYGFDHFPGPTGYRLQKLPGNAAELIRRIPLSDSPDASALGAMYTVLGTLIPRMEPAALPGSEGLVQRAIEYLSRHPERSIPDTAQHCGVAESTLYAAFRSAAGTTPNEMRQQLLVEKAVRLLITTSSSVQQISEHLHFSSPDYFRRILKKHTGMSPRQIRSDAKLP